MTNFFSGSAFADMLAAYFHLAEQIDPGLIAFALVIAASPGPSNIVLLSVGSRVGARAGLPLLIGMALGYGLLWGVAGSGLRALAAVDPAIVRVARWLAVAFMLFLVWRMVAKTANPGQAAARPVGVWSGILFQAINPKAWITAAAAAGMFCNAQPGIGGHAVAFAMVATIAVLIGCGAWLVAGGWGAGWLGRPGPTRVLNSILVATLLASMVPVALSA